MMVLLLCLALSAFAADYHSFHIALIQNTEGIEDLRYMVSEHISNPHSKHYGKYLTTEEINLLVSPPAAVISPVTEWLDRHNIHYRVTGDTIHCIGRFGDINRMLQTNIQYHSNYALSASTVNYVIPDHLRDYIQFIDGISLQSYHRQTKPSRRVKSSSTHVSDGYVTREVFNRVYNLPEGGFVNSSLTSVGAMEYEGRNGFSESDMVAAQTASNVPANPVAKDHIVGSNNSPDGESQLDMAVIWWGNGNATLWYEDFRGWMYSWATAFLNRKHYPEVVSISWGWNERDQCSLVSCLGYNNSSQEYVKRANDEFLKLSAKGVTLVVSSGDAGSPGRTNEGCSDNSNSPINPVFPGSSEWVTSVGATYLVSSATLRHWKTPLCHQVACANGTVEQMTTYHKTGWTSGSGWSWWSQTPKWQQSEVKSYLQSGVHLPTVRNKNGTLRWNPRGRGYPDVSAFGHSCTIHSGDGWTIEDGTSCSAPIFAGILTYLNDHQRSRNKPILGFANPLLYQMGRDDPSTFNDIIVGNSACTELMCCGSEYGFSPTKGWDVVSGLGTPNIGNMLKWLDRNT